MKATASDNFRRWPPDSFPAGYSSFSESATSATADTTAASTSDRSMPPNAAYSWRCSRTVRLGHNTSNCGQIPERRPNLGHLRRDASAVDDGVAAGTAKHAGEDGYGGGLPRAVVPEQRAHLSGDERRGEIVHRDDAVVEHLSQPANLHRRASGLFLG